MKALSVNQLYSAKKQIIPFEGAWLDAFGCPESSGTWFIWGNSGNGKSSFAMQLCRELTKFGKVIYNSMEEADSLSMINTLRRYKMEDVGNLFQLLPNEPIADFVDRMDKKRAPDFYVVDSIQYANISYKEYIKIKEAHRNKLLIFISQCDGKKPLGNAACKVMYDADLKIFVSGYRAFSKGRFIGSKGDMDVWAEKAAEYWGEESEINNGEGI